MKRQKILTKILYFLAFILMIGLLLYSNVSYTNRAKNKFSVENYLENPQKYGDHKDERFGKIINISQDHFYFDLGDTDIKIFGSGIKKPILGETVVFLNFKKDGRIELIDYHNYNYNYILYTVSFLALIVFAIIFFKEWKITLKGFKNA